MTRFPGSPRERNWGPGIVVLLWWFGIQGAFPYTGHAIDLYSQAQDAFSKRDFGPGVKLYYKALLLGEPILSIPCRKQDLRKAWQYFNSRRKGGHTSPKLLLYLGMIRRICEEFQKAEELVGPLARQFPQEPLLTFVLGELLLAQNQADEASKVFFRLETSSRGKSLLSLARRLLKRAGFDADQLSRKQHVLQSAFRHLSLMDYDRAAALFNQVLEENPRDVEATTGLLTIYMEDSRLEEAVKILDAFRQKDLLDALPPLLAARILYLSKRFAEVIDCLTPFLARNPESGYARQLLAESLFQEKRTTEAIPEFQWLSRNDPANTGIRLRLAACLEDSGNHEEARNTYLNGLGRKEKAAKNQMLQFEYAEFLARQGRYQSALEEYAVLERAPGPYQKEARLRLTTLREFLLVGPEEDGSASTAINDSVSASTSAPSNAGSDLGNLQRDALLLKIGELD